jgi:hypothetical protein
MTVLGITSATSPYQTGNTSPAAQALQDFQALGNALKSGDLSGAQQAFATLQQNLPSAGQAQTSHNPDSARQGIQNLGNALQSGNISDAQQVYAKLQQNMGEIKGRGHHAHHNHKGGTSQTDGGASGESPATAAMPDTYTAGGLPAAANLGGAISIESQSINISIQINSTQINVKA